MPQRQPAFSRRIHSKGEIYRRFCISPLIHGLGMAVHNNRFSGFPRNRIEEAKGINRENFASIVQSSITCGALPLLLLVAPFCSFSLWHPSAPSPCGTLPLLLLVAPFCSCKEVSYLYQPKTPPFTKEAVSKRKRVMKTKLKNIPSGVGANLVFALPPGAGSYLQGEHKVRPYCHIHISCGAVGTAFKVLRHPFAGANGCHKDSYHNILSIHLHAQHCISGI